LAGIGKPAHEALEASAELLGIEPAKQTAERVVAQQTMFQLNLDFSNLSSASGSRI
jgi:hypothetical protein